MDREKIIEVIKKEEQNGLSIGNRIDRKGLVENIVELLEEDSLPCDEENIRECLYGMDDISDYDDN